MLLSINWNPNPELFNLFGISIRYYGLLWAVGIFFAYVVVHYQYRDKKIEEKKFDPLFFYCFFGILIGARPATSACKKTRFSPSPRLFSCSCTIKEVVFVSRVRRMARIFVGRQGDFPQ